MEPPRLPWEVIERVIDLSCGNSPTLRSFSLTCHQLRPRSRCVMFARVNLRTRDRIFAFIDFLQDNPYLIPFVRSIVAQPLDFAPFPLLHILSSLSYVRFTSGSRSAFSGTSCILHQSTLTCLQRFGSHIQTLHLFEIRFATFLQFAGVLLAFTNVEHLTCERVIVDAKKYHVPPEAVRRRVSERMRLKTMTIDSLTLFGPGGLDSMQSAATLLFDSDLGPSTVHSLRLIDVSSLDTPLFPSEWPQLRSLVLQSSVRDSHTYGNTCKLLENFPKGSKLAEVTVERTHLSSIADLPKDLRGNASSQSKPYERLEQALLRFSQPRIVWIIDEPTTASLQLFWTQELSKHFPTFSQRGTLTVSGETRVTSVFGHEASVDTLAVSPNSKWVATGSHGASTIILWDANGNIAQQWVANGYAGVQSLAFSPNSQYLLSVGGDKKAEIWDLGCEPASVIATLPGAEVLACAWSLDGSVIATASGGHTVRLWDAHTFQGLAFRQFETRVDRACLTFSQDGRWLAFSFCTPEYCIMDVALGQPHRFIHASLPSFDSDDRDPSFLPCPVAIFHPGNTRLATRSASGPIFVWDVETGERLFVFGDGSLRQANDISFSPDGTRVLAASEKGIVCIWDASTGAELIRLTGHTKRVRKACFSPCGRYVASASDDRTVRLWRPADNGACVATFSEHEHWVEHVAFSPNGETLSSAAEDGTVCVRRMRDIIPVDG